MSARDELAEEITKMLDGVHGFIAWTDQAPLDLVDVILAAGYSKPRTITTVDELDALVIGTVVLDHTGDVLKQVRTARWLSTDEEDATYVVLPATVIHEP